MWSVLLLILIVGAIWLLINIASQINPGSNGARKAKTPVISPQPVAAFSWPGEGNYDFEVVGESNYQRELGALADTPDPEEEKTGIAILVPEDDNPHDNKAIRVTVQGLTIGYLSREDARSYRRRLATKKLGMVPASCGVMVTGGYLLKDGSKAHYGAQLDMKPFD